MRNVRGAWSLAGVVAGLTGLALSYLVANVVGVVSPVVAVAQTVVEVTPGPVAEWLIGLVGTLDKPLLVLGIILVTCLVLAWAGRLARRAWWAPLLPLGALLALAGAATATRPGVTAVAALPLLVGFVTWVVLLSALTARLESPGPRPDDVPLDAVSGPAGSAGSRRGFLTGVLVAGGAAVVMAAGGRLLGGGRRAVEESRRLLRLEGVTRPVVPPAARVGLDGVTPWLTPVQDFYRIDTALVVPVVDPAEWSLRIHGMVEREVVVDYAALTRRLDTEAFVTLCCVSNPVGGDLIGNAWWSGVRVADLLAEAGVSPDADAVLQTSEDGWTCSTPLTALTDGRDAMLAVAMDGKPLPLEHGFPVRMVVPGLYGYVSATKWVVDLEVTRFDQVDAYWTQRGWGEQGPIKISSRVDVPASGDDVPAGAVAFGGVAWAQHTGIAAVEVSLDGGPWEAATIGDAGLPDAWVQWRAELDVEPGDHLVRVRATDADGVVQDPTVRDVLPDGATGYAERDFTAS